MTERTVLPIAPRGDDHVIHPNRRMLSLLRSAMGTATVPPNFASYFLPKARIAPRHYRKGIERNCAAVFSF